MTAEALAISDRIMVMSMARIAQDGTPRAFYEQPISHFVADFIGDANIVPVIIEVFRPDWLGSPGPLVLECPHRGAAEGPAGLVHPPSGIAAGAGQQSDAAGR